MNSHPTAPAALGVSAQCLSPASNGAKDTEWCEAFAGVGREGCPCFGHIFGFIFPSLKMSFQRKSIQWQEMAAKLISEAIPVDSLQDLGCRTLWKSPCQLPAQSSKPDVGRLVIQPSQQYQRTEMHLSAHAGVWVGESPVKTHHFLIFLELEIMVIYLDALLFSVTRPPGLCHISSPPAELPMAAQIHLSSPGSFPQKEPRDPAGEHWKDGDTSDSWR